MGGNRKIVGHLGAPECGSSHGARNRARDGVFLALVAWLALAVSPGFAAADSVGPQYTPALPSASGHSSPGEVGIAPAGQPQNKDGTPQAPDANPASEETPIVTEPQIDSRTVTPSGMKGPVTPEASRAKKRSSASGAAPKKHDNALPERAGNRTLDDGGAEFPWLQLMLAGVTLAAVVSLLCLLVRRRCSGGNQTAAGRAR